MNQTTKINKLKHMRLACLKLQMQHGELCVFRVEDALPPEKASIAQTKLFIKEQRSKRAEEAKALELRIIALKASMQAFVKRHRLDPAITSICFSAEEKARKASKKTNYPNNPIRHSLKSEIMEKETEQLILEMQLKYIFNPHCINTICSRGYCKTQNKFSISFNGSEGYLDNISIDCEGFQKATNNRIDSHDIFTKSRSIRKKKVNIYHSERMGVRVSFGKDEPLVFDEEPF